MSSYTMIACIFGILSVGVCVEQGIKAINESKRAECRERVVNQCLQGDTRDCLGLAKETCR